MVARLRVSALICLVVTGCAQRQVHDDNAKVSVSAPFVDVNVAEQGGVNVRAPFTRVDTTRHYLSSAYPSGTLGYEGGAKPAQFQPPGTTAPYNPRETSSAFQPQGAVTSPSLRENKIPPASTSHHHHQH